MFNGAAVAAMDAPAQDLEGLHAGNGPRVDCRAPGLPGFGNRPAGEDVSFMGWEAGRYRLPVRPVAGRFTWSLHGYGVGNRNHAPPRCAPLPDFAYKILLKLLWKVKPDCHVSTDCRRLAVRRMGVGGCGSAWARISLGADLGADLGAQKMRAICCDCWSYERLGAHLAIFLTSLYRCGKIYVRCANDTIALYVLIFM